MSTSETNAGELRQRHHQVVHQFFELMHHKEIDAWGDLWHDDGCIVTPYPADGFPTTIAGKDAILTGFRGLFGIFDTYDYELSDIYPAADAGAVVVEWKVRATLLDGAVYTNDNITVFRFKDGLIIDYHDYFDPRRFQTVIDALADR